MLKQISSHDPHDSPLRRVLSIYSLYREGTSQPGWEGKLEEVIKEPDIEEVLDEYHCSLPLSPDPLS